MIIFSVSKLSERERERDIVKRVSQLGNCSEFMQKRYFFATTPTTTIKKSIA
jgi:hypothetical protein